MELFNQRYARLAVRLGEEMRRLLLRDELGRADSEDSLYALSSLATAAVDSRNYVILGDPAVRSPAASFRAPPRDTTAAGESRTAAETEAASIGWDMTVESHASVTAARSIAPDREMVVANGVDGATGDYLLPSLTPGQLALLAKDTARYTDMSWEEIVRQLAAANQSF
jgi:hypothetical protein